LLDIFCWFEPISSGTNEKNDKFGKHQDLFEFNPENGKFTTISGFFRFYSKFVGKNLCNFNYRTFSDVFDLFVAIGS
jgi:hypothetical protein